MLYEWDINLDHFVQICPLEMLNKLDHPLTNKVLKKSWLIIIFYNFY